MKSLKLPRAGQSQISAVDLYNMLTDGTQFSWYIHDPLHILLLDTRTLAEYSGNHIISAVHCAFIDSRSIIQNLTEFHNVVLYGTGNTPDDNEDFKWALQILKDRHIGFQILAGGFTEFSDRFPFLCNNVIASLASDERRTQLKPAYPSLILEDWLYQGDASQALNQKIIDDIGITHILNISIEHPCPLQRVTYLAVKLKDERQSKLINHFEEIFEFLDLAKRTGGKALVHCNLGVSRSSTATLAYMMLSEQCSLSDAWSYLYHRRPVSGPNLGFFLQLGSFEKYIFGKSFTDANALWKAL